VVVLTNQESVGILASIAYRILDSYLERRRPTGRRPCTTSRAAETEAAETVKQQSGARNANSKPSLPLEKYAGKYADAWYGDISISMNQAAW